MAYVNDIGSEASLLLLPSRSARTPSPLSSNHLMRLSDEHWRDVTDGGRWIEAHTVRNDLGELLNFFWHTIHLIAEHDEFTWIRSATGVW
jgi:hypothetical protein